MPWQTALRNAAGRQSLAQLADRLGYSKTALSQVLNGKYPSPTDGIEAAVRAHLMDGVAECPAIGGEIPMATCLQHQQAKQNTSSPLRIKLYRACRSGCPHSCITGGANRGH